MSPYLIRKVIRFSQIVATHLLDHESGADLVEELVVVLGLGPLVLARDLHHVDVAALEADAKMQSYGKMDLQNEQTMQFYSELFHISIHTE